MHTQEIIAFIVCDCFDMVAGTSEPPGKHLGKHEVPSQSNENAQPPLPFYFPPPCHDKQ